jgi:hypothetical protein
MKCVVSMADRALPEKIWKPLISWKEKFVQTILPRIVNKVLVMPFLWLVTRFVTVERTPHSIERIGKVIKKYKEGYSVIIIPSHPMERRHTLGMGYHCVKISREISGEIPHVVLATDETTFVYIKIKFLNRLVQKIYRIVGKLAGNVMLNRYDPNSAFRAGIDIARLLRNQSIVVMAGEGYPRHDSRKYVDIPNIVESFFTKLKNKNMLPPSINKSNFISELARDIQNLIDKEDKRAYRSGKLSEHILDGIRQLLISNIPPGFSTDVDDILDELLINWEERFGPLRAIDPVIGITVQPQHKTLILPVVFTEHGKRSLHVDVRDFFLIDGVSYTEIRASMRDMEQIQRCNIAMDMLNDEQHSRIIREICQQMGVIYEPSHNVFEEYHAGKLPFQALQDILEEKLQTAHDTIERRRIETFRDYLRNFEIAAIIAALDESDRAILQEAIKLSIADLEQVIPSIRIRQAWKSHGDSERIAMEEE